VPPADLLTDSPKTRKKQGFGMRKILNAVVFVIVVAVGLVVVVLLRSDILPWWASLPISAMIIVALVAGGYAGTRSVTRDIEELPRMVEAVLGQIPVGTPIDDAQRFMEREGFACSRKTNAEFLDRMGLDYVDCDRSEGGIVRRRWQVAVVHRDGKVTEVIARTGLVGPQGSGADAEARST
jgi:hypothetical protein